MSIKLAGIILIVVGVIAAALFFTADLIGIGGKPGFGYFQMAGVVVGIVVLVAGIILVLRKPKLTK